MFLPNSLVTITSLIADQPIIGVDAPPSPARPVISDGEKTVWNVQARFADDGIRARITMDQSTVVPRDGKVVLAAVFDDAPPLSSFEWILKPGPTPEVDYWSIINPENGFAWTLNSPAPMTQIVLERLRDDIPDSQKFATAATN